MSLYQAAPGVADPVKFNNTLTALDLAVLRCVGAGVLSGLTVDNTGTLQPGEALIGHVVALAAAFPLNTGPSSTGAGGAYLLPSATNWVYLQMPPVPACVGADGRDAGLVVVNQTGVAPVNAVLLAAVTTGPITGPATVPTITGVNNAPAGRSGLAAPLRGETRIALAAQPVTVTPGTNYTLGADFSAAGVFADTLYRVEVSCAPNDPNLIVSERLGKTTGKLLLTLHYILASGGSTAAVNLSLTASAKGAGYTGQQTAGIVGVWDALTSF